MQCQICGKRPAVVHFTEIVNNKKSEYHVCEKCAEEKGYHVPLVKTKFSVGDLLAGMVEQPSAAVGPMLRPNTFRRLASEAGFADVQILDEIEHESQRFYRLTP